MNRFLFPITVLLLLIALPSQRAAAQQSFDTIYISDRYTTSFLFTTNAVFARLSSEDYAAAAFAEATNEVVYVRAKKPFTEDLSLSVIEASGKPHTYILRYAEHPGYLQVDERNGGRRPKPDTLRLSSTLMTTLLFSSEIVASDLSRRRLIEGAVVKQSPNVFSIMAKHPHEESSSLAILEESGAYHTYIILNDEHPSKLIVDERHDKAENAKGNASVNASRLDDAPSLQDVYNLPQSLYHIGTQHGRIRVVCENVFTYSDVMYITIRLDNNSGISYETDGAIFTVKNRKKTKRTDDSGINRIPSSKYKGLSAPSGGSNKVTYAFEKFALNPNQVLQVTIQEKGYEGYAGRTFFMTLSDKDINLATRPTKSAE